MMFDSLNTQQTKQAISDTLGASSIVASTSANLWNIISDESARINGVLVLIISAVSLVYLGIKIKGSIMDNKLKRIELDKKLGKDK